MGKILVIDIGTTSMRGVIFNENGQILFNVQKNASPHYWGNCYVEQDPVTWESTLIDIISESVEYSLSINIDIQGIAVTAQRSSLIPVDGDGKPLHNAIMWQDKRTYELCQSLKNENQRVYSLTGLKIDPAFTAPKITWLKRNLPEIYEKANKLIVIQDYVLFLLTGNYVTDHTFGSRTLLMNIRTLEWEDSLLELFEVDKEKLCDLVPPGSVCGYLTSSMSKKTGAKQGIPVITAGGDQQCAALGLNVINQGYLETNIGTGSYVVTSTNVPILDNNMRLMCNVSAIPGKWILEATMLTSGTIYRWFNENFYHAESQVNLFEEIDKDAQLTPAGSNGLILLPHFKGSGSPYWNPLAKGMFFNIGLETKRGDFARAILEGVAAEMAESVNIIQQMTGDVQVVSTAGGMTRFDLFNQIQADMYEKKVICYESQEATSIGAWISSSKTVGITQSYDEAFHKAMKGKKVREFEPGRENAERYKSLKMKKNELYKAMEKMKIYDLFT